MKIGTTVRVLALVATLGMAACATPPGSFNGDSGYKGEPMGHVKITSSAGRPTARQYIVAEVAIYMNAEQLDLQDSGLGEATASEAAAYCAGYGLAGATQPLAYTGVGAGPPALWGCMNGLFGGAVNGLITYSYDVDMSTGTASETTLRDWEKGIAIPPAVLARFPDIRKLCQGLHTHMSITRSLNKTDHPAPGLVPDWKENGQPLNWKEQEQSIAPATS